MKWNYIKTDIVGHVLEAIKLPKKDKEVLLYIKDYNNTFFSVGYLRYAAGDRQSPHFVTPGVNGSVIAWCDCLPSDFVYPIKST
jgi:hypothetical protein